MKIQRVSTVSSKPQTRRKAAYLYIAESEQVDQSWEGAPPEVRTTQQTPSLQFEARSSALKQVKQ